VTYLSNIYFIKRISKEDKQSDVAGTVIKKIHWQDKYRKPD
jgi:hypothetical protein